MAASQSASDGSGTPIGLLDVPVVTFARAASASDEVPVGGSVFMADAWRGAPALVVWLAVLGGLGCGGASDAAQEQGLAGAMGGAAGSSGPDDPSEGGVQPRFALSDGVTRLGDLPWPDDLYRQQERKLSLEGSDITPLTEVLVEDGRHLDGFGVTPRVFVRFDGALDPASWPATPFDTLDANASVFLVNIDPGSPAAFRRVPVRTDWEASSGLFSLTPAPGWVLSPGQRYAAVITNDVRGRDGQRVQPAPLFRRLRDSATRPDDALLAEAYDHYAPVIAGLEQNGVPRSRIAALAVFTVQTVGRTMAAASRKACELASPVQVSRVVGEEALDAVLGAGAAGQVGLDGEEGAAHDGVGWMVHGSFGAPSFLSTAPGALGVFEREQPDDPASLRVKRTVNVPLTLWLPKAADAASGMLPLVIVQHDLGRERSDALAVANALTRLGYAVAAIDAPFHGMRQGDAVDAFSRFGGARQPDGFADDRGNAAQRALGLEEGAVLPMGHPFYVRDTLRQLAADLSALVCSLRASRGLALTELDVSLPMAYVGTEHVGYVGMGWGGHAGMLLAGHMPTVDALVLAASGGSLSTYLTESPVWRAAWLQPLLPWLRRGGDEVEPGVAARRWPELVLWQMLADRGDPLAYATVLRDQAVDVLMPFAVDDEMAPNLATEWLGHALGGSIVGTEPRHATLPVTEPEARAGWIGGNFDAEASDVTRLLLPYAPAAHDFLRNAQGTVRWAPNAQDVLEPLEEPSHVSNPIEAALEHLVSFFESWRSGQARVTL